MGETMTVQETFTLLNKRFESINIKPLSELPPTKDDIVSTGIMGLDIALGVGGIKKGSIKPHNTCRYNIILCWR